LRQIATAAAAHCPVFVVDDGSDEPLAAPKGCQMIRLERNRGKGAALTAGFRSAAEAGFTHAITMDADGQHSVEDLPGFLAAAQAQPEAMVVGVRDFYAAACPPGRRWSNWLSSLGFRVETGLRLGDSQCGFRCYPLALTQRLKTRAGHFAFESEFMARAAWVGTAFVALPVKCSYTAGQLRQSHFHPVWDFAHVTLTKLRLALQSRTAPRRRRAAWSCA
jgi:glycosyltransferase involved in cell wall biosynthesis